MFSRPYVSREAGVGEREGESARVRDGGAPLPPHMHCVTQASGGVVLPSSLNCFLNVSPQVPSAGLKSGVSCGS